MDFRFGLWVTNCNYYCKFFLNLVDLCYSTQNWRSIEYFSFWKSIVKKTDKLILLFYFIQFVNKCFNFSSEASCTYNSYFFHIFFLIIPIKWFGGCLTFLTYTFAFKYFFKGRKKNF